jgi:urease accessory protein UreE
MEETIKVIKDASIPEKEEIIVDFARWLEIASQDALVYGEGRFAVMSANMAQAIRINADELARDNPETTERVLQQACEMISQFKAVYPHRVLSRSVH